MIFARYTAVQVIAYGIDFGVFYLLYGSGLTSPVVANVGGKVSAGVVAFIAHRGFTFRVEGAEGWSGEAFKYFALLGLNTPISSGLLAGLMLFSNWVAAAKVVADVLAVGLTYTVTKYVVFTRRGLGTARASGTQGREGET